MNSPAATSCVGGAGATADTSAPTWWPQTQMTGLAWLLGDGWMTLSKLKLLTSSYQC